MMTVRKLLRAGTMMVAAVIAAGTMTAGTATAAHPVGPDHGDLLKATWYGGPEPTKQLRVTKVVSTSDFDRDAAPDGDEWWVPSVIVGEGVPEVARYGLGDYALFSTSVIRQERISGNRYRLEVPGAVLEALLEPRSGW